MFLKNRQVDLQIQIWWLETLDPQRVDPQRVDPQRLEPDECILRSKFGGWRH